MSLDLVVESIHWFIILIPKYWSVTSVVSLFGVSTIMINSHLQ